MMLTRPRRPLAALAVVGALAWPLTMGGPTFGQESIRLIPQSTIVATEGLNDQQLQEVREFVKPQIERLTSNDAEAIRRARRRLLEPVEVPGATGVFKNAYSQAVSSQIAEATQSDRLLVRLNAIIVLNQMTDERSAQLAERGLNDDNAAIRYWAVKALGGIAQGGDLNTGEQLRLLDQLDKLVDNETSPQVLRQVLNSMDAMPIPAARERLLDALDRRLRFHVDRPRELYEAERLALRSLYLKLVNQPDREQLRQLARLSTRYMMLITSELQRGADQVPALKGDFTAMLKLVDPVLRYSFANLGGSGSPPDSVERELTFGNWGRVQQAAQQWRNVLTDPTQPYKFRDADMTIVGAGDFVNSPSPAPTPEAGTGTGAGAGTP